MSTPVPGPPGEVISTPVPGLLIVRKDRARESYDIRHAHSGLYVIYDCAGPGTADSAARDLSFVLDWTMTARRILTVTEAFPETQQAVERIAAKWGASALPRAPFQVSA